MMMRTKARAMPGNKDASREYPKWMQRITIGLTPQDNSQVVYRCRVMDCGTIFRKKCNLLDHYRTHTRTNPYTCKLCGKDFSQSGNLGRHLRSLHFIDEDMVKEMHAAYLNEKRD